MMSDAVRAVILGIIEGVTEFLPVSSTGHLLLAERFFDLGEGSFWNSFVVLIQLGAILAIVALYFAKIVAGRARHVLAIPTTGASSSACWWRSCPRS